MHWDYEIKEINGKKYLLILGIELNYANPHGYEIIKETEHFFLCRQKGHRGWFSLGQQEYYLSSYSIYKKTPDNTFSRLFGFYEKEYTRETMKETKKDALQRLEELEKGDD